MDNKYLATVVDSIKPHADAIVAHSKEADADKSKENPEHVLNHLYSVASDVHDAIRHAEDDVAARTKVVVDNVKAALPVVEKVVETEVAESESFLKRYWRYLAGGACVLALAALAALAPKPAHAAGITPTPAATVPQINTGGNFGGLTIYQGPLLSGTQTQRPGGPVTGDFSGAIQDDLFGYYTNDAAALAAGGGYVITDTTWVLYGQSGYGACSGRGCVSPTYRTDMPNLDPTGAVITPPLVTIVPAVPQTTNALDANGQPIQSTQLVLDANGNPIPLLDANGNPVLDASGNPVYQTTLVFDAHGNPVYDQVPVTAAGFCGASPCQLQQWIRDTQIAVDANGNPVPAVDANGNPVLNPDGTPVYATVPAIATLVDGTPAAFNHYTYACRPWLTPCDAWKLGRLGGTAADTNVVLPPRKYLVYFTGSGCSGRGCTIPVGGFFFSAVHFVSHQVVPPPTCGTPTTPPCEDS